LNKSAALAVILLFALTYVGPCMGQALPIGSIDPRFMPFDTIPYGDTSWVERERVCVANPSDCYRKLATIVTIGALPGGRTLIGTVAQDGHADANPVLFAIDSGLHLDTSVLKQRKVRGSLGAVFLPGRHNIFPCTDGKIGVLINGRVTRLHADGTRDTFFTTISLYPYIQRARVMIFGLILTILQPTTCSYG